MNIDKNEMTLAYIHRDNPRYFNQFISFIDEIGNFCVKKLNINEKDRDDVKQVAVEHAYRKMDHFDPEHGSAAYSFFYKVILRRCLYELRDMNKKKNRMPDICSLDKLYNAYGVECDDPSDLLSFVVEPSIVVEEEEDNSFAYDPASETEMVMINSKPYNKNYAIQRIKEAKSIVRREKLIVRRKRLFSLKTNAYFTVNDEFVRMVCVQIVENKEKKSARLQRSK